MKKQKLPAGDTLVLSRSAAVLSFAGRRRVLSSSPLNGGMREDLHSVFNYDECRGTKGECRMRASTYREHLALVAEELGLGPESATGLSTSAQIHNLAVESGSWDGYTLTALVTAGVDVNGGRVGEPARWREERGIPQPFSPGTVNILLHLDADLDPGGMAAALMLCTEAKTAVMQELFCASCCTSSLATGTGTDGVVVISNSASPLPLSQAGQHYRLGELIGSTVKAALRRALFLQTGLCPERQHSVRRRMGRYGVTGIRPELDSVPAVVTAASLYAHLLDQLGWNMLSCEAAAGAGSEILNFLEEFCGKKRPPLVPASSPEQTRGDMIRAFSRMISP